MASLKHGLLLARQPLLCIKRFRGKINIQKPRKPHFERQLLIDLCKPHYGPPKNSLPDVDLCTKIKPKPWDTVIENPFENILAKECFNWFNSSKMIIILHMNSINMEEKTKIFVALRKHDMHLRTYGKKIVRMATAGTKFEAINVLFASHQNIIFGSNDDVARMLKIMKKAPQMVVMAGIIHGRLMSKTELVEYSQLPDLQTVRSQLCSVLQMAGSNIVSQMIQHQTTLVTNLDSHAKQLAEEGNQANSNKQETT